MRKRYLAFLAVPVATIMAVPTQGQSGTPAPVRGGNLTVAMNVELAALDPTQVPGAENARVFNMNVLEGLVGFTEMGKIVPVLASALPTVSADGTEYTFRLRPGVKFHDGSAFSSSDVKVKFDRARTKDSGHTAPTYFDGITSVTTPDANTVVFKLAKPNTSFVYNLAQPESIIEPEELFANAAGLEKLKVGPIGTGPFKFKAWNRGSSIVLERNPDYYVRGLPYLDTVTFRPFGDDQNARVNALRSGDVDAIGVPAEQAKALQADANFKVYNGVSSGEITISLNNQRKPFNDLRVRRALTLATDKQEIVNGAFFGFGTVIGSFNSPGQPYYIDLSKKYSFNLEQARALLQQAGVGSGFKFKFTVANEFPIERRTAEVWAAQLQKIGVTAEIELVPFNTWIQKVFLGKDYDVTIIGHAEAGDIDRYARDGYYFNWDNKDYKTLYEKALVTTNEAERTRIYWQMQNMLADRAPGIWVFSAAAITAVRANVYNWWKTQPTPNYNVTRVFKTR
jgi:peptide/nickel transport system substrate-binding protein